MNRDWFSMVHPESAASRLIGSWLPQLLVDSHEMGSNATYLFSPPRHPFNPFLPRQREEVGRALLRRPGRGAGLAGLSLFHRGVERGVLPRLRLVVGLVPAAPSASSTRCPAPRARWSGRARGHLRTFAQAVEHQVTSSVANLRSLADNRPQVLPDQAAARTQAVELGRSGEIRAWVFPAGSRHPDRLDSFARVLRTRASRFMPATRGGHRQGAARRRTGKSRPTESLPAGSLLVRLDQPAGTWPGVHPADPHVPMETVSSRKSASTWKRARAAACTRRPPGPCPWPAVFRRLWSASLPGGDWQEWPPRPAPTGIAGPGEFTSLILDGDPDATPRVLAELLQAGVVVRVAKRNSHRGQELPTARGAGPAERGQHGRSSGRRRAARRFAAASTWQAVGTSGRSRVRTWAEPSFRCWSSRGWASTGNADLAHGIRFGLAPAGPGTGSPLQRPGHRPSGTRGPVPLQRPDLPAHARGAAMYRQVIGEKGMERIAVLDRGRRHGHRFRRRGATAGGRAKPT